MKQPIDEDSVKQILLKVRPDIELAESTNLIEENIIDSVDVIEIVVYLEKHFSINIDPKNIEPKYFESISTLTKLVNESLNE